MNARHVPCAPSQESMHGIAQFICTSLEAMLDLDRKATGCLVIDMTEVPSHKRNLRDTGLSFGGVLRRMKGGSACCAVIG